MAITKVKVVYDDGSTALFDTLEQAVAAGEEPQPAVAEAAEAASEPTPAEKVQAAVEGTDA